MEKENNGARKLKIISVNKPNKEQIEKTGYAITFGSCLAGLTAAIHFSDKEPQKAVDSEISKLNSFTELRENISKFTTNTWKSMIKSATIVSDYIKASKEEVKIK